MALIQCRLKLEIHDFPRLCTQAFKEHNAAMGKASVGMIGVAGHHVTLGSQCAILEALEVYEWPGRRRHFLELGFGTGFLVNACCALGYPVLAVELPGAATTVRANMQPHDLVTLVELDAQSIRHEHIMDLGITTITCLIGQYAPTRWAVHLFEKVASITELAYLQPSLPSEANDLKDKLDVIAERLGWTMESVKFSIRLAGRGGRRTVCITRRKPEINLLGGSVGAE